MKVSGKGAREAGRWWESLVGEGGTDCGWGCPHRSLPGMETGRGNLVGRSCGGSRVEPTHLLAHINTLITLKYTHTDTLKCIPSHKHMH